MEVKVETFTKVINSNLIDKFETGDIVVMTFPYNGAKGKCIIMLSNLKYKYEGYLYGLYGIDADGGLVIGERFGDGNMSNEKYEYRYANDEEIALLLEKIAECTHKEQVIKKTVTIVEEITWE